MADNYLITGIRKVLIRSVSVCVRLLEDLLFALLPARLPERVVRQQMCKKIKRNNGRCRVF
jgi:hypothetical protein